ncbi:hypothetical protein WA026_022534 [Henosepilachna vigintioctopunctata]|uniref:Uncharacterized protein n=1 Tax=Henosepilachna vigintioctopunctata TaxID=420089 RepID=A0AAW1VHG1_9CUCU
MEAMLEKFLQKFADQEKRREQEKLEKDKQWEQEKLEKDKQWKQEKLEKEKRRLENVKRREQEKLENEQRRQRQRLEDKQHLLNFVANLGQDKRKLKFEMSPVRDELMCPGDVIFNETGKRIPGNSDNAIGLEQNMGNDDRQGMDMKNRKEEGPEKGDSDVIDVEVKMSGRGGKLTNPEHLNEYKVSSAYYLKKQNVRKGRSKGKNKSLQKIEMFSGLGYVLAPEGMRAQQSKRSVKRLRDGQLRGHRQLRRPSTGHDASVRALESEAAKIIIVQVFDLGDKKPILTTNGEWNGITEAFAKNGESLKGKSYSCVKGFDKKLWFSIWV